MNNLTVIDNSLALKFKLAGEKKHTIDDFCSEFLNQFISKQTKIAYVKDLSIFFDFLKSGQVVISSPADIQAFHFRIYRDYMIDKGLSSATITRRLVVIRSFVKWAIASNLMTHNPLDAIKLPKVQTETETAAFTDAEVVQMLNSPDTTNHKGRMQFLVLSLLFNLGLRRSELVNIKVGDFYEDRDHKVLKIVGKGQKVRNIAIRQDIYNFIQEYCSKLSLTSEDYLIQTEQNIRNTKPINGSTIYRIVVETAKKCRINKQISPHSCRATLISHLLDTQNTNIREVATLVGHANITTTEIYDKRRNQLEKSAAYVVNYGV